ncbi:MAG: hypothetical protein WA064_01580 [Candidatus Moraniibacteriota bacterium]
MNLSQVFAGLGFSQKITLDLTLFLVLAFASFVFGMLIGRYRLMTVLINIYVAIAILGAVSVKLLPDYSNRLILFFGIILVLTLIGKKMFEIPISGGGKGFLWRVFVMSFLELMLMLSMALTIIPKKIALGYVSSSAYDYLVFGNAPLVWMLLPLIFMFLIHKKISR